MTFPSILIGIVISSLYGAVFHLVKGGGLGRLLLYLILAWIGFWLGHLLATRLGWSFLTYGTLQLGSATLGAAVTLFLGHWLSLVEKND
jgi:uncharacterized membrane protein YeaQ/YmgE (transglycosylase-associated protein family)